MDKIRKIDNIARLLGTGDGLPQTGKAKDRHPKLRSMMLSLIASCQGRDVSHQAVVWRRIIAEEQDPIRHSDRTLDFVTSHPRALFQESYPSDNPAVLLWTRHAKGWMSQTQNCSMMQTKMR
jgi:hypothetical protein